MIGFLTHEAVVSLTAIVIKCGGKNMLYVFIILLIIAFISQRKKMYQEKRNLALFLLFSLTGIVLGIVHNVSPYLPSIALMLEEIMK